MVAPDIKVEGNRCAELVDGNQNTGPLSVYKSELCIGRAQCMTGSESTGWLLTNIW